MCKLSGETVEKVTLIVSDCKVLAQKDCKRRHDKAVSLIFAGVSARSMGLMYIASGITISRSKG